MREEGNGMMKIQDKACVVSSSPTSPPFDDFMDISGTTHPNLASDSHSFEAVSHAPLSPVIDQAIFPFISYFFP